MMLHKVLTENKATYLKPFCKNPNKCFSNLEPKLITDNKKFWKLVKPLC